MKRMQGRTEGRGGKGKGKGTLSVQEINGDMTTGTVRCGCFACCCHFIFLFVWFCFFCNPAPLHFSGVYFRTEEREKKEGATVRRHLCIYACMHLTAVVPHTSLRGERKVVLLAPHDSFACVGCFDEKKEGVCVSVCVCVHLSLIIYVYLVLCVGVFILNAGRAGR